MAARNLLEWFPEEIDSTMLSAFAGCEEKWRVHHLLHLTHPDESVHLVAGRAFADAMERGKKDFYDNQLAPRKCVDNAIAAAIESYGDFVPDVINPKKTVEMTVAAVERYFQEYPLGIDPYVPLQLENGNHALEWKFSIELPLNHPVTGLPLRFVGTLDSMVENFGQAWGMDEKTMGQTTPADHFSMRGQFFAYGWAARQLFKPLMGFIVRGVLMNKVPKCVEYLLPLPQEGIDEWEKTMLRSVQRMLDIFEKGRDEARKSFGNSCTDFWRLCPLAPSCVSNNQESEILLRSSTMEQNIWLPSVRKRVPLEEHTAAVLGTDSEVPE